MQHATRVRLGAQWLKLGLVFSLLLYSSGAFASNRVDCPSQTNWSANVFSSDQDDGVSNAGAFAWSAPYADAYFGPDLSGVVLTPTCGLNGFNEYVVYGNQRPPGSACPASAQLFVQDGYGDAYGVGWYTNDFGFVNAQVYRLDYGYAIVCAYWVQASNTLVRGSPCVDYPACSTKFDCAVENGYVSQPPPIHATSHYFLDYHQLALPHCNGGSI